MIRISQNSLGNYFGLGIVDRLLRLGRSRQSMRPCSQLTNCLPPRPGSTESPLSCNQLQHVMLPGLWSGLTCRSSRQCFRVHASRQNSPPSHVLPGTFQALSEFHHAADGRKPALPSGPQNYGSHGIIFDYGYLYHQPCYEARTFSSAETLNPKPQNPKPSYEALTFSARSCWVSCCVEGEFVVTWSPKPGSRLGLY